LLTGLLEEAEDPARLDQQNRGTCTVSSATILLARTNPAEYVRLVADLASVQGTSVTAGGPTITRQPDWNAKDDGGRTPSMRLLQPALMEYYNGPRLDYDNKTDRHKGIGWLDFPNGLKAVLEALTGKKWRSLHFPYVSRTELLDAVLAEVQKGGGLVPVALKWGSGQTGHEVLVHAIDRDGKVHFTNPQGAEQYVSLAEFRRNLYAAHIPA
jgi:hypothetical protein